MIILPGQGERSEMLSDLKSKVGGHDIGFLG